MSEKEAKSRIKINKLLEESGWRFFDDDNGKANILLEKNIKITRRTIDEFGEDIENTGKGYVDFMLCDDRGFSIVVLEAKSENKNPLVGKEQARTYANNVNCRFEILSNGNIHYFWDIETGNPHEITKLPTLESLGHTTSFKPNPTVLISEPVESDYVALSLKPFYRKDP